MAFIEWNQKFSVKVEQFDDHHRHLINLLNKTYENVQHGLEKEKLGLVLIELIDYAKYHFSRRRSMDEGTQLPQARSTPV